jgi:hypothetical protein
MSDVFGSARFTAQSRPVDGGIGVSHVFDHGDGGTGVQAIMIASQSARRIAEEWMIGPCTPGLDGAGIDLGWFHGLAETRPLVYARLVPKVARMVESAQATEDDDRLAYCRAFEIMRETLTRI